MTRFTPALVVALFLVAPDAAGQTAERRLPPTFRFLRPGEPGQQPPPVDPNDADFNEKLATMRAWISAITDFYVAEDRVLNAALAEQLISELYVDHGHPNLNYAAQGNVVFLILHEVAPLDADRLPDDARSVLAAGMLEYLLDAGGGRSSPTHQTEAAEVLDLLAPYDPAAQSLVDELLEDALQWSETSDNAVLRDCPRLRRVCRARWGDLFALRLYDIQTRAVLSDVTTRPSRYDKAVAALRALVASPPADRRPLFEALREATGMALLDFKEPALNDDLTCRLLIAYRALLARRPPIHARAVAYIEDQLLRLVSRSERLNGERHWELWSQAARELGNWRVSKRFQSFLRRELEREDLPELRRKHLERLRPLLEE